MRIILDCTFDSNIVEPIEINEFISKKLKDTIDGLTVNSVFVEAQQKEQNNNLKKGEQLIFESASPSKNINYNRNIEYINGYNEYDDIKHMPSL